MKSCAMTLTLCVAVLTSAQTPARPPTKVDIDAIAKAIGAKGAGNEAESVYKVSFPRDDVSIEVDGRKMEPFMGFTSWAAFQSGKAASAMVMGDLVLFEDEINPVMDAAFEGGLQITALHNHFFYDDPRAYFMHIGGEGRSEERRVGKVCRSR